MLCVIVLSGSLDNDPAARKILSEADRIISVDGGSRHLQRLNVLPEVAMGDFDSIDQAAMSWLRDNQVPIRSFPTVKDKTDSQLAIDYVLGSLPEPKADHETVLLAALGSRPDHVLANQLIAAELARSGWRFALTDGQSWIYTLSSGQTLRLDLDVCSDHPLALSVLAIGSPAAGLSYDSGLQYPLHNKKLMPGDSLGISNKVTASPVVIRLDEGTALVFVTPEV